jgi:signal peptidase I
MKAHLFLLLLAVPAAALGQRLTRAEALQFINDVAQDSDRVMPVAATGSMYPFLDENCLTLVRRVPESAIQDGDIVIYERDGKLIGHRVVRLRGRRLIVQGDHNRFADVPVDPDEIRAVVVAMASFDPKSPPIPIDLIGFEATNRELQDLPVARPFTLSEAWRAVHARLTAGEKAVAVSTTGDNIRRSEQCILVVRKHPAAIQVGDMVTLKLSLLARFVRLFRTEKDSTARRVAEIGAKYVTVYREGRPDERAVVPRSQIEGLVLGCVFFAGRDAAPGESIYLE